MSYKYTPLQVGEFRVLRLLPGQNDQPIHADLDIRQLDIRQLDDDNLLYEAPSYC